VRVEANEKPSPWHEVRETIRYELKYIETLSPLCGSNSHVQCRVESFGWYRLSPHQSHRPGISWTSTPGAPTLRDHLSVGNSPLEYPRFSKRDL